MIAEKQAIRCPRCQWFVVKLTSAAAEVEANCANDKCRAVVIVKVVEGKLSVEAEKRKQAT
jgi:hypothetical protein